MIINEKDIHGFKRELRLVPLKISLIDSDPVYGHLLDNRGEKNCLPSHVFSMMDFQECLTLINFSTDKVTVLSVSDMELIEPAHFNKVTRKYRDNVSSR